MIQARYYQSDCNLALWEYFRTHGADAGNPLCVLPTGTGKSVCIALFIESVMRAFAGQRILVLTHVKELIQQNYNKLMELWPTAPAGIYSSGLNRKELLNAITFAGVASIVKVIAKLGIIDLVVIDEAHLLSPNDTTMYRKILSSLLITNPFLKVIGFTATDYRLGQGKLTDGEGRLFTDVVYDISTMEGFNRLIDEGYLAPLLPRPMTTVLDVEGLHIRGGEFIEKEMQDQFNKEHITRAAIEEALVYKDKRKSWLVFTSGIEHADAVADMLNEYGIKAIAVHSKMKGDRDEAIKAFKRGEYQAIVNNNILTTGFDHPPIDLILCLRATASPGLWVQMLGRGTRPYNPMELPDNEWGRALAKAFPDFKLNCLVLDYARNTRRLGPINDPVIPRAKGKGGGDAPIKECPGCGVDCHASVRFCGGKKYGTPEFDPAMGCGYEFDFAFKVEITAGTDDIIKDSNLPVVEVFKVDHISYEKYLKQDRPPSMKVTYYCGLNKKFTEYVCVEHPPHQGGHFAKRWMRERILGDLPETTEALLAMSSHVDAATHLRVWTNKKPYTQIMGYCYDGSGFGRETEPVKRPTVDSPYTMAPVPTREEEAFADELVDDDIPF